MFIDHIAGFECMKWLVSGRAFYFLVPDTCMKTQMIVR